MTPNSIDRYQIIEELGRGGMATVYKAHDPLFEREVAIKVLPPELSRDSQFRARFIREARTIAALEHPAIVPVYDYGENYDQPYLVMRYMTGGSLTERLREGPLSLAETSKILQRIGSALDAAHQKGVIHRDLKPGNILFDQYGEAYLADFGIVHLASSSEALTATGSLVGTPSYMSPEQVHGDKELDGRSDIYALGVILFQMLTGDVPYAADTPVKTMMQHVMEPIPRILERRPDLAPQFDTVITKAMAKDRDERFTTGSELSIALYTLVAESDTPAKKPPTLQPSPTEVLPPEETSPPPPARSKTAPVMPPPIRSTPVRTAEAPSTPQIQPRVDGKRRSPAFAIGLGLLVIICLGIVGGGIWVVTNLFSSPVTVTEEAPSVVTVEAVAIDPAATETAVALIATRDQQALDATTAAEIPATNTAVSPTTDAASATPSASQGADLLATRQALEAAATAAAANAEVVRPASGLKPVFGPSSGAMPHIDDEFLESVYADPDPGPADLIASAIFTNPFVGSWDYGFIFRQAAADDEMRLVVHSDGFWNVNDRHGDEDVFVAEGEIGGLLDVSQGGQNELVLAAIGERGYFFLNGRFIATLDLSSRTTAGDLAVATGFYTDSERPGASTAYTDFTVWPAGPRFGPAGGEMEHVDDGFVKDFQADVDVYNFIATAEFGNPYPLSSGSWDAGFTFRDADTVNQFWFVFESSGDWSFINREEGEDNFLLEGTVDNLDTSDNGTNQLRLIAVDDTGYVFINDELVSELDLSPRRHSGDVTVVTTFFIGNEIEGSATTFTDFTVWELP